MKRFKIFILVFVLFFFSFSLFASSVFATDGDTVDYTVDCIDVTGSNLGSVSGSVTFNAGYQIAWSIDVYLNYPKLDSGDSPVASLVIRDCTAGSSPHSITGNMTVPTNGTTKHFEGSQNNMDYSEFATGDLYVIYLVTAYYRYPSLTPIDVLTDGTFDSDWINGDNAWRPSLSGSLNDYNCTSNIADFATSANFDLQSLSVDGLDTSGMTHILNSSFDSASGILTVYFDNTLEAGSHSLLLSGSGVHNGSNVSAQGHIDFTFDCTVPPVPEGAFKIVVPADGQQFSIPDGDSGITTDLTAVYQGTNGGTDGDMTQYSCNFLVQDANLNDYFPQGGGTGNIPGTYDSSLNRTTWTSSYQFPAGNYTFTAKMLSSPMLTDSISFDVLGAEGDITNNPFAPLINWLKKWFVKVMEYLFVPTQQQISSLLPTSPVGDYNLNPFSSSMFPSPLYSVDFPITSTNSLTLSIDSVPSSLITAFRAFSQIFISLALLIFLIKGV